MRTLAIQDLNIAIALESRTLTVCERPSRLGGTYVAISDEHGIIEACLDMAEAEARIVSVFERIAK